MIKTFKDKDTQAVFEAKEIKDVPRQFRHIVRQVWRRLDTLEAAPNLKVLGEILGKKNFKALKFEWKGQCAIRVNDQYRICFEWRKDNNAYEVELNDHYWD